MSNLTFRTSPPPTYLPPTREEMAEAAKTVGLKGFAPDLVADLTNLAAGGAVCSPSSYREEVRARAELKLPAPGNDGGWSCPSSVKGSFPSRIYSREEAVAAATEAAMRYHQNVCDFLQTVDLTKFPGGTPLEQAVACLKLLSKQQGGEPGSGDGGEPLPIFQECERPEGIAESLHETMEMVESLSNEELDMVDPEGKNHEPVDSEESSEPKALNALKVAEDLSEGSAKRVMLEVSRQLDQISKLQLRKQNKLETDPAGEEVRQRQMRSPSELNKVAPSSWATYTVAPDYFWYQVATNNLQVRERVTRITKKQAVFILLDGSASMHGSRHHKATGVVMNRLKAVIAGDAEVFLSVFDTRMGRVERASTPEEARKLMRQFADGNFSGGGTDIAAAVRAAHGFIEDQIKSGAALYRPEVVVLTDNDPSASGVTASQIKGTRVHGFAMDATNPQLANLARSTGGVAFEKF
jgi:hypothetical protein